MSTTAHTYREGNIVYNNIDDVTGELFNTIDTALWYNDIPIVALSIATDPIDNIIFFDQWEPLDDLNITCRKRIYTNGVNCNWFGHGANGLINYLASPCSNHERVLNITEPIILLDNNNNLFIDICKPDLTLKFVGGRFLFGQITGLKTSIVVENKLSNRMNYIRSSIFSRLEKLDKKEFDIDWKELFIDEKLDAEIAKEEKTETNVKEDAVTERRPIVYSFTTHIFNFTTIRGTWDIDHAFSSWFFTYKNGYVMTTTNITALQNAIQNNTSYVPVLPRFNDDTKNLQQLLNLKARTTTIEDGIYMIDPTNNPLNVEDPEDTTAYRPYGGLTLKGWTDAKLILNGTLKGIPNRVPLTSVMRVEFCKGITIEGEGKIQGDLIEHLNNTGEGGMGIRVHSSSDLTIKDITVELCFGDCIFVSWNGRGPQSISPIEESRRNQQRNHTYENVKINYGRRTGLVYELGNDVRVLNCDFSNNGALRGTATYSAVDIEPFGDDSAPIRYCRNFSFKGCVFIHNGNGVRAERCLNMTVDDNYFENNGKDIELLECFGSSYDITGPNDRGFIGGLVNIIHNKSFNSGGFLYNTGRPSKVIVRDNYTQNTNDFLTGLFLDSTIIRNKIYNCSQIFDFSMAINTAVVENEFFHINFKTTPSTAGLNNGVIMRFSATGTQLEYSPELWLIIQNFKFNNNIIHDLSGEVVRGSGTNGIQPLPNSTLRNNFLGYIPENLKGYVEFKDNIFPKSRIILPHNAGFMNVGFTIHAGDPKLTISNKVGNLADQKLLMVGDIVWDEVYQQEGICTQFGRIGVFDDWMKITQTMLSQANSQNPILIPANTIYYLEPAAGLPLVNVGFSLLGGLIDAPGFPGQYSAVCDSYISLALPVIEWRTKGKCTSTTRPSLYNTIGRTLYDTTIHKDIIYDGSNWKDTLNNLV